MDERFRKRLNKYLELSHDEDFIQLVWAANMLQGGHADAALRYLKNVPREAITEELPSPKYIYKWELETLVNELLVVPKRHKPLRGQWRKLDCSRYDAFCDIVNKLRGLENFEAKLRRGRINILREMPRISSRQFAWQRGWLNIAQFYRYTFIYGKGFSAEYFERKNGITVNKFSLVGFVLHTLFSAQPVVYRHMDLTQLPLSADEFQASLGLLSISANDARQVATSLRRPQWPAAYQPSLLRQYPCLAFGLMGENIRSPLPQLIIERVTSGLFYDVAGAGREVREEYGRRFELYALEYLKATLPSISWSEEKIYKVRKQEFKSPDILWIKEGHLRLAIECKATRMSVDARFSDDPLAVRGYDDLVKAVFQLWRFFSHCRRGRIDVQMTKNTTGLVLTLDSWLQMANDLTVDIISSARKMAAEREPQILPEDCRPVIFCAMNDLETVLLSATESSFEATIAKAVDENREGWMLSSIHEEVAPENAVRRSYPFEANLPEVLPWWGWLGGEVAVR